MMPKNALRLQHLGNIATLPHAPRGSHRPERRSLDGDPPGDAGADELAAAVAAELGDPPDDVRLSVLIGTIAMSGQLGPEAAAAAAIEAELSRLQPARGLVARSSD